MQLPQKMSAHTVMASITRSLGNREHKSAAGNEIRFAGDDRKDKLYEPKHKQKLVRVLTVVAYVIFVSLAAILLSLYYTFLWDPKDPSVKMRIRPECATVKLPTSITSPPTINDTQIEKITKLPVPGHPERLEINGTQRPKSLLTMLTESIHPNRIVPSDTLLSSTPEASTEPRLVATNQDSEMINIVEKANVSVTG